MNKQHIGHRVDARKVPCDACTLAATTISRGVDAGGYLPGQLRRASRLRVRKQSGCISRQTSVSREARQARVCCCEARTTHQGLECRSAAAMREMKSSLADGQGFSLQFAKGCASGCPRDTSLALGAAIHRERLPIEFMIPVLEGSQLSTTRV